MKGKQIDLYNLQTKTLSQNIQKSKQLLLKLKQGYNQEECDLQSMLKNLMGFKRLSRQINTDLLSTGKKQKTFQKEIDKEYWTIQSSEYEKSQFDTKINQIKNYQNKCLKKLFIDFNHSEQAEKFQEEPNDQASHQQNLKILQDEEKARKTLASELSELKEERNKLQNQLNDKRQSLFSIPKIIQNLKQASLPIEEKLKFSFHQTRQQFKQAYCLIQPLYIAFHKFNQYIVINKKQEQIQLSIENTNEIIQQEKALQKQNLISQQEKQQQLQQQQQQQQSQQSQSQQQEQHHGSQEEGQMPQHDYHHKASSSNYNLGGGGASKKERRIKSSKVRPQQLTLIYEMLNSGEQIKQRNDQYNFAGKCLKIVINSPIRSNFNQVVASECYPLTIVLKCQTSKNFITINIMNRYLQADKIFGSLFPHDHGLNLQSGWAFNFLQLFCGNVNLLATTKQTPSLYMKKQDSKEQEAQIFYSQQDITAIQILRRGQKKIEMCLQMAKFLDILCKTNTNFTDTLFREYIDHNNQEFNFINEISKEFQYKYAPSILKLSHEEYFGKWSRFEACNAKSKKYLYRNR